jgi:hypothetical protein
METKKKEQRDSRGKQNRNKQEEVVSEKKLKKKRLLQCYLSKGNKQYKESITKVPYTY